MMKSVKYIVVFLASVLVSASAYADGGSGTDYSPYSKFGIGTLNRPGSSYIRSMGGVGTATRDARYMNPLNPASATARDSLSFMADFSVSQMSSFLRQGDLKSINNSFNISNFAISFPIYKSSAMMLGINPFSAVGYDILNRETNKEIIGYTGNIADSYSGSGSIYEIYIAGAATFWKRFSVGAQFNYYFGTLEKASTRTFSLAQYRSMYAGSQMILRGCTGKIGLQYEIPVGKMDKMVVGATYRFKTQLNGENKYVSYAIQSEVTDTLAFSNPGNSYTGVDIPSEISGGLSFTHADKFRAEVNFTYSNWKKSRMDEVDGFATGAFSSAARYSVNAGVEFTPNRGDIRYFMRRCSYRIGGYYNNEHYKFDGNQVVSYGLTLGMTMPIFRWYNGLTIAVDLGKRGNVNNNMILERYVGASVGLNIFDIWFLKPRYE